MSFHRKPGNRKWAIRAIAALLCLTAWPGLAAAFDRLDFAISGQDDTLKDELRAVSLLSAARAQDRTDPRDVLAAARADYARLLQVLYRAGHYGGVIRVLVDGREASSISPFAPPEQIGRVLVQVDPGPQFSLSRAEIAPLARGTELPEGFAVGRPAGSEEIQQAVAAAVDAWRSAGRAKARVADQSLLADHSNTALAVRVGIDPGPKVRFGRLNQTGPSAVRTSAIARIAGFPSGSAFDPERLENVATRLRRTGAFGSVTLSEAEALRDGDLLDVDLALVDAKPRRLGFGAEMSSLDGLTLSGYWLHRNLFGGAERFRVEAEAADLGTDLNGADAALSARLSIPAVWGPSTSAFVYFDADYVQDPGYTLRSGEIGAGLSRTLRFDVAAEIGLAYSYSVTEDGLGRRELSILSLPGEASLDRRDDTLDPVSGYYAVLGLEPFISTGTGVAGLRSTLEGRGYFGLGADDRLVFAARAQLGAVIGAEASDVPADYLFFSGGGGTVRGFAYQSQGVETAGGDLVGGRGFAGLSAELRYRINDRFGAVGFVDMGHVGPGGVLDSAGDWHAGAGLGLRYFTSLGPIRVDVALPVQGGGGGNDPQFYIGIGQAF